MHADYAATLVHDSDITLVIDKYKLQYKQFLFSSMATSKYLIDLSLKDYLDYHNQLKNNINLKTTEPFIKTINKNILLNTDWKITKKIHIFNSISDPSTDSTQFSKNSFCTKLFTNTLPIILDLHKRYPSVYSNPNCK